jgi:hypothetical protein
MKRIGDRSFMFAWQTIRAATQPSPEATSWQVDGVEWRRHRYSHTAPDHIVTIEVFRLDLAHGHDPWSIMIVYEHWWDGRHKPLRDNLWATQLTGSRAGVEEWVMGRAKSLEHVHQHTVPRPLTNDV